MRTAILAGALLAAAGIAGAQDVTEAWLVPGGGTPPGGNAWLAAANTGRAITFIDQAAASNLFGTDIVVVASDVSGTAPTFQILNAGSGAYIDTVVSPTGTGNGTVGLYQMASTTDGIVIGNGFGGEVLIVNLGDGGSTAPTGTVATLAAGSVTVPTGSSRAIDVIGSYAAGTAKIFLGRGNNMVVYSQDAAGSSNFTAQTVFDAAATATVGTPTPVAYDVNGLRGIGANADGTVVAVCNGGGSTVTQLLTGTPTATGYTKLRDLTQYNIFVKSGGIRLNSIGNVLVMAEGGGTQDGFMVCLLGADTVTPGADVNVTLNPTTLDGDADNVYDASATDMNAANLIPAITIDRDSDAIFGYSSQAAASGIGGGVFSLSLNGFNSNVSDWEVFE